MDVKVETGGRRRRSRVIPVKYRIRCDPTALAEREAPDHPPEPPPWPTDESGFLAYTEEERDGITGTLDRVGAQYRVVPEEPEVYHILCDVQAAESATGERGSWSETDKGFVAPTAADRDRIEGALKRAGVPYTVTTNVPDQEFLRRLEGRVATRSAALAAMATGALPPVLSDIAEISARVDRLAGEGGRATGGTKDIWDTRLPQLESVLVGAQGLLADDGYTVYDPYLCDEWFQAFRSTVEELKNAEPELFRAVPLRELPEKSRTGEFYGRGHYKREHLMKLVDDLRTVITIMRHNPPSASRGFAGAMLLDPTGWPRVDRALGEVWRRLEEATSEEQFQAVGQLCRDTLISLAQAVHDPNKHRSTDGTIPSETDAARMLEAYLGAEMRGGENEDARRCTKAALTFANALVHKRTAQFREAALCATATSSVINIIAIVSGHRDPGSPATQS